MDVSNLIFKIPIICNLKIKGDATKLARLGKDMKETLNFDGLDNWIEEVQVFIETHGTPSMDKKMQEIVNRKPTYFIESNSGKDKTDKTYREGKINDTLKIIDLFIRAKKII